MQCKKGIQIKLCILCYFLHIEPLLSIGMAFSNTKVYLENRLCLIKTSAIVSIYLFILSTETRVQIKVSVLSFVNTNK
jgi:hypothetical protein